MGCVPNTAWAYHQRIRQYEGAHNETWGGVVLNIDNNVLDGLIAIPIPYIGAPIANFYALPLSGNVPLTVAMYIVNTANITSCSWSYGDGQTGTSCASSHNHTYNSPGSYTVSLTVSGPGGSDAMARSNYIVVSQPPPPSQPDLVPYPRVGRLNPVIISSVAGTSTNDTLVAGQQIFIDWGFKNNGNADINTNYYVDLYIDNQRFIHSSFTGLGAGALNGFDDWGMIWNTSGWHTVKLVVDPENSVSESNENNNVWTGQFYWGSTTPTELTTISPTGTISITKPAYVWNAVTGIVSYELYVYSFGSASNVYSITSIPTSICSVAICTYNSSTILSPGDFQFMVGAKNLYGTSTFSAWMTFTVGGVPVAPTTVSPTGTIMDNTPSYAWTSSVGASSYDLYVYSYGSAIPIFSNSSIPASSNCTAGTCTWTPSTGLPRGSYQFNVRARNLSGVSDFSAWGTFTVDTGDYYTYRIYLPLAIR
jgi:PKD repeat protein